MREVGIASRFRPQVMICKSFLYHSIEVVDVDEALALPGERRGIEQETRKLKNGLVLWSSEPARLVWMP